MVQASPSPSDSPLITLTNLLVQATGTFDECVEALLNGNPSYSIAEAYYLFAARVANQSIEAPINQSFLWFGEGVVYWPNKESPEESTMILIRPGANPLTKSASYARMAREMHGRFPFECYLTPDLLGDLRDVITEDEERPLLERHTYIMPVASTYTLPVEALRTHEPFLFLVGDVEIARAYCDLLRQRNITEVAFRFHDRDTVNRQPLPYVRQLKLGGAYSPTLVGGTSLLSLAKGGLCGI